MTSQAELAQGLANTHPQVATVHALLAVAEAIDRLPVVVTTKGTPTLPEIEDAHRVMRERMGDRPFVIVST